MNDSNKTTTTQDDVPLVQASLLDADAESFRAIRTDFVVIDEYFDVHNGPDLSLGSSNSVHSTAASTEQNTHYPGGNRFTKANKSNTFGAWAAGIVLGFLMGAGPSLSMAFGIGAAYCSQQEEGVAGDVARAFGDVAILSHEKFVEVNEKHNLIDTVASGTVDLSRNCLIFVRRYFSTNGKKNRDERRQTGFEQTEKT